MKCIVGKWFVINKPLLWRETKRFILVDRWQWEKEAEKRTNEGRESEAERGEGKQEERGVKWKEERGGEEEKRERWRRRKKREAKEGKLRHWSKGPWFNPGFRHQELVDKRGPVIKLILCQRKNLETTSTLLHVSLKLSRYYIYILYLTTNCKLFTKYMKFKYSCILLINIKTYKTKFCQFINISELPPLELLIVIINEFRKKENNNYNIYFEKKKKSKYMIVVIFY